MSLKTVSHNDEESPWGQTPPPKEPRNTKKNDKQKIQDIDDVFVEILKLFKGGGSSNRGGGKGFNLFHSFFLIFFAALALWLLIPKSGSWYVVREGERGVVLKFGSYSRTVSAGFHFKLPTPFEKLEIVNIDLVHVDNVGFLMARRNGSDVRDNLNESHMLTGDQNIVNIHFTVQWRIKNASEYLFNVRNPDLTIRAISESAMREVVGRNELEAIITRGRQEIQEETKGLIQIILDDYGAGIQILQVQLQKADPPSDVIDAFRDVVNAGQDAEAAFNRSMEYYNDVVPKARGDAAQIEEAAKAYKERVVAEAKGEADRFSYVLKEYELAPQVTRQRLYLEAMEDVLSQTQKIIVDTKTSQILPYLSLDKLKSQQQTKGDK